VIVGHTLAMFALLVLTVAALDWLTEAMMSTPIEC
jgi:hypothetical protein